VSHDVVVVGARCAGATLALQLARAGARVLMLDRDELGSDTLSTHVVFPNTVARLAELGILARLRERHEVPDAEYRVAILGHEIVGTFTPVDGFDRAIAPRRVVLDRAIAELAMEAGAETRFSTRVRGVLGTAEPGDPVRGVVLEDGETIEAEWVIGADGRASTIAKTLGLPKERPMTGEFAVLLAYWHGIPPTDLVHLDGVEDMVVNWMPCEDGISLLVVNGPAEITRGDAAMRKRRYLEGLARFPRTLDPAWLADGEMVTEVRVAPETMLRGFYRPASGAGWALVGDAGHFKHPATAQGISDAVEQAVRLAEALQRDAVEDYGPWRDRRAAGHYEWSFQFATFPKPDVAGPIFAGLAADPDAAQDFRDVLSRRIVSTEALTPERLQRWFAAAGG
jgi:2-polyprenyl-6-methoxyphenol hydroxylase-like FAD-dependent oxidoreductase